MSHEIDNCIHGAIYDFMGYITTQEYPITVSSHDNPTPLLERYIEWCKDRDQNKISINPRIEDWQEIVNKLKRLDKI